MKHFNQTFWRTRYKMTPGKTRATVSPKGLAVALVFCKIKMSKSDFRSAKGTAGEEAIWSTEPFPNRMWIRKKASIWACTDPFRQREPLTYWKQTLLFESFWQPGNPTFAPGFSFLLWDLIWKSGGWKGRTAWNRPSCPIRRSRNCVGNRVFSTFDADFYLGQICCT